MMNFKKFSLLLVFAAPLMAQDITASYKVALAGSGDALTIQKGSRPVAFSYFYVDSTADLTVTLERSGALASSTQMPLNFVTDLRNSVPSSQAFFNSNVGVGKVIGTYLIPGEGFKVVDLSRITLQGALPNLTVRLSSITGIVNVIIHFVEN